MISVQCFGAYFASFKFQDLSFKITMQYALPQFTDVEDKLIGPLTLKQFLFLFATGLVILFFYSLLKFSIFFFFFSLPVLAVGVGLSFGALNGRPLYAYIGTFINYATRPQVRVFKREEPNVSTSVKKEERVVVKTATSAQTESRLKKLAYILDQRPKDLDNG